MTVLIPATLQKNALAFGTEGTRWLANLPAHIAKLEQAWDFRVGPAFDHGGTASWVAPVPFRDGSQAVLKIGIPHDEARFEAQALRFLDGGGAVRLLQASDDGFSLLLERCLPGTDLWSLEQEAGDAMACQLLPRIWREPDREVPFMTVSDQVETWWNDLPRITAAAEYDEELVARAVVLGRELAASQSQHVFLHGDFHPGNILAAQREPWLVIDPKPLVGEPAYDLAQWLGNRCSAAIEAGDPVTALRLQITRFATGLDLDPARIAGWAFVKALGWEWGPDVVALFDKVAQAW